MQGTEEREYRGDRQHNRKKDHFGSTGNSGTNIYVELKKHSKASITATVTSK
ncbi:MAG: hypothetical protein IJR85_00045 [Synergistaceae bacterium]|nr:hypothetical protein [Synergistaceae bacterium]